MTHHATSRMTARKMRAETVLAVLADAIMIAAAEENIFLNFVVRR